MIKIRLQSIDDAQDSFQLIEVIPDTHAWIKSRDGKFVYANRLFLNRFGFDHIDQLRGKNDFDISPTYLAADYSKDDEGVLAGEVVTDRLELIGKYDEAASWFLTSKWPVYDIDNQVIGTFGASRHLNTAEAATTPFRDLNGPIEYIRRHFSRPITVEEVAQAVHLSVSALERRFKKHLSKTPRHYIMELRLDYARKLLAESSKNLASIALEAGFSDHSHFTRAYQKRFKISPSLDRKRMRG